jgi:hypothetical protein
VDGEIIVNQLIDNDDVGAEAVPDAEGNYVLYAIRNKKSGRLLTMLAGTTLSGDVERKTSDNRYIEIDGMMQVLDYQGRNPVFTTSSRTIAENLLRSGDANEYMNLITLDRSSDFELVTLKSVVTKAETIESDGNEDDDEDDDS